MIDSETVARWLGGWHLARTGFDDLGHVSPLHRDRPASPDSGSGFRIRSNDAVGAFPLMWTQTAVDECSRMRRIFTVISDEAEPRFAAALVTVMVRLIVDGPGWDSGIADVPLLPPFALRVMIEDTGLTVLGPRQPHMLV